MNDRQAQSPVAPRPPVEEEIPRITVVMAVRDGGPEIDDQLAAMARQSMTEPWELIVVDNGSQDDTVARVLAWKDRISNLRLVPGPAEPSRSRPLNMGAAMGRAGRIAFCDADDVVGDRWVESMAIGLADHGHVTGPIDMERFSPSGVVWSEDVLRRRIQPPRHNYLPYASTCNAGWRREVFDGLGGFDEVMRAGHDTDLSWRTQLAGHELGFEPGAVVHRRCRTSFTGTFRQYFRYGRSNARHAVRFRPYGIPIPSWFQIIRVWAYIALTIPKLLTKSHRMQWASTAAYHLARYFPVARSERTALQLAPGVLSCRNPVGGPDRRHSRSSTHQA